MTTFAQLELIEPIQKALAAQNYVSPTPIQAQSIPHLLDGRDVIGCAQTGTGKTAAFALPVLQKLGKNGATPKSRAIRALILSPTRELAAQIGDSFKAYSRYLRLRHLVIFGGVNENPQINALRRGTDILIATPGRLLDLMSRGFIDLTNVEFFVLDEADRMLDMGFVPDVRRVLKVLPKSRQNLLFSATMSPQISGLANTFITNPIHIEVTPEATTVEKIDQHVMFVEKGDKTKLLLELLGSEDIERGIVFTRTKHGADKVTRKLAKAGYSALAIHGNKSQNARNRALDGFRCGDVQLLVATDIASRGIDVDEVTHVFNFDLPNEPESYVHRIGRTGRAGRSGTAIAFCSPDESAYLVDIEKKIAMKVPVNENHTFHCAAAIPVPAQPSSQGRRRRRSRSGNRSRSSSGHSRSNRSRSSSSNKSSTNSNAAKSRHRRQRPSKMKK